MSTDETGTQHQPETSAARPALRIVSGNPTPEELAALTVVLSALGGRDTKILAAPVRGGWADPVRSQRAPLRPGPGAWRASASG
jgi:hypothetical protein